LESSFKIKVKKQKITKHLSCNDIESTISSTRMSVINDQEQEAITTLLNLGVTSEGGSVHSEIASSGQFSSFTSGSDDPTHVQTVDTVDTLTTFVANDTTSKQLNTIAADKPQSTTIERDKNKSQNILLQRRGNNFELNESAYRATFDDSEDSDDEVEIVDIIKDYKGEQSRTKNEGKTRMEFYGVKLV